MSRHPAPKERHKVTPVADNDDIADDGPVDPVTGRRGDRSATELDRTVGTAIRQFRDDLGLTRDQVNAVLNGRHPAEPWDDARLARIEGGVKRITIVDAWRVIDALGVRRGLFAKKSGLVETEHTVEEVILGDPKLTARDRGSMLRFYQALITTAD